MGSREGPLGGALDLSAVLSPARPPATPDIGVPLSKQQKQKIVQYLNEAHGAELALVRQLQAQIAMTPSGSYRDGLESHLRETRGHAERIERRLSDLGQGDNPLQV